MDNGHDMLQLCRLCLVKDDVNIPIFQEHDDNSEIFVKISSCLPVKLERNDKLPQNICDSCFSKLDVVYDLWTTSSNSDKQLHKWLYEAEAANAKEKRLTKASNKSGDAIVKQEKIDDAHETVTYVEEVPWDGASSSAGPSASLTAEDEPPPKRARRAAAVKASITVAAESDDDDDDDNGPMTKMEDDSDENDPTFGDVPSTSADDQPGPSGVGKDGSEAPDLMSLLMPEVSIIDGDQIKKSTKKRSPGAKKRKPASPKKEKVDAAKVAPIKIKNLKDLVHEEVTIKEEIDNSTDYGDVLEYLQEKDTKLFNCTICKDEVQRTLPEMKKHYKMDHKGKRLRSSIYSIEEFPCDVCGKIFRNSSTCKEHLETHMMYYYCESCQAGYKRMLDYIIHVRSHSAEGVFKCVVCDMVTENVSIMAQHLNDNHTEQYPYKYKCKSCDKGFNVLSWYQEHTNYHSGLKPFYCELCETSFMYSRLLQAHNNMIHKPKVPKAKVHICIYCSKEYQHRNSLKVHMNVHTGNYSICDICGKTLSSKEKLKFHLRTHTGYKPYTCTYCGKSFTKKPILIEHIRTHTGEKPYNCEYCEKSFSQRSSLVIHTRGHTGERPYVCNFCNKGFVAKAMLNIHIKSCKGLAI